MSKSWLAVAFVALGALALGSVGCAVCDAHVTRQADAPRSTYDAEIAQCTTQQVCLPLCRTLFAADSSVAVVTCHVTAMTPTSAHVVAQLVDESTCGDDSDASGVGTDDGSTDDGSDDGSDDDGSDDGSSDDGSSDDGSSDDGSSDDGSSDDGDGSTDRHVTPDPHHHIKAHQVAPRSP